MMALWGDDDVKIEKLETVWLDEYPHNVWLRIHTDEGLVGLGETFYAPRAVTAIIHDVLSNLLIGQSAFDSERLWADMFATVNFFGFAGAEMRAISAVDIALWDLVGQYTGQPNHGKRGRYERDHGATSHDARRHGAGPGVDWSIRL